MCIRDSFNILGPETLNADAFDTHRAALARAIEDCATALDGTVSAEHGIGLLKKQALRRMRSDAERGVMARVRTALDPAGLLNPGKVFDIG